MPTTLTIITTTAGEATDEYWAPQTYRALTSIGDRTIDPPVKVEGIDRVNDQGSLDPTSSQVIISAWFGLKRPHAMVGIWLDESDPITLITYLRD